MKKILLFAALVSIFGACSMNEKNKNMSSIDEKTISQAIDSISAKYPGQDMKIAEKGVRNAAGFWTEKDGKAAEFVDFCKNGFMGTPEEKQKLFETIQRSLEVINGNYNRISLTLKEPVQLVGDDYTATDEIMAAFDPYSHFADDMFANKVAFSVLLNFPFYNLQEKNELGAKWTRQEWAYARMGDLFTARVPAELAQKVSNELAATENYISNYNIHMHALRTDKGEQLFTDSMALITHWGLRDELKADYADKVKGPQKQEMIYEVMKRIIDQSIPEIVIDNGDVQWQPYSNKVFEGNKEIAATPEPDTRYKRLFAEYEALKAIDPYCKSYPDALKRGFDRDMEVSADDIEKMFTSLVSSPEVGQVAALIKKRLGRDLRPYDIWYDGFKSRSSFPENEMTAKTRKLYPSTDAFKAGMPSILTKLGFEAKDAEWISSRVVVDNSRGSGHAWGAQMKSDVAHLRTRLQPGGMDYKGYNIALHEFGHNVEQTISLNMVDNYIMNGIPSTAFTEALAFVFQKRDLDVLGYKNNDPSKMAMQTLDIFWGCYEIMGVSLVDLKTWKWLYENPNATAGDLKATIIRIAKEVWNQYYAEWLGEKDSPILAVYSHMIEIPLYLSNYPYGHIVEFQLEKHFGTQLPGSEIMRIYPTGRLTPDYWMKNAVGEKVSITPMLEAVKLAVKDIN